MVLLRYEDPRMVVPSTETGSAWDADESWGLWALGAAAVSRGDETEGIWNDASVPWKLYRAPELQFQDCAEGLGLFASENLPSDPPGNWPVCPATASLSLLGHHWHCFHSWLALLHLIVKR